MREGMTVRGIALGLVASALVAIGAPAAHAGVTCEWVPSMCPAPPGDDGGKRHHPVPEPGALGLLALGAAASVGMLRRKKR